MYRFGVAQPVKKANNYRATQRYAEVYLGHPKPGLRFTRTLDIHRFLPWNGVVL